LKPWQICVQLRQEYNFFSVKAAKRFLVRSKEEMEQLIRDKSSKSTNKATQNAVKTLKEFCKEQNLHVQQSFEELNKTDLNSLLTYVICSIFELGGITKHLMTGPKGNSELCFPSTLSVFPSDWPRGTLRVSGKQNSTFPLGPVIKCLLTNERSKIKKINQTAWKQMMCNLGDDQIK